MPRYYEKPKVWTPGFWVLSSALEGTPGPGEMLRIRKMADACIFRMLNSVR